VLLIEVDFNYCSITFSFPGVLPLSSTTLWGVCFLSIGGSDEGMSDEILGPSSLNCDIFSSYCETILLVDFFKGLLLFMLLTLLLLDEGLYLVALTV
jgi:hypothetical protein